MNASPPSSTSAYDWRRAAIRCDVCGRRNPPASSNSDGVPLHIPVAPPARDRTEAFWQPRDRRNRLRLLRSVGSRRHEPLLLGDRQKEPPSTAPVLGERRQGRFQGGIDRRIFQDRKS